MSHDPQATLSARDVSPATCTDHLGGWYSHAFLGIDKPGGVTRCSCGWVARSTDSKEGGRQQRQHRAEAMAMEDAAAQAGFIPASWRKGEFPSSHRDATEGTQ